MEFIKTLKTIKDNSVGYLLTIKTIAQDTDVNEDVFVGYFNENEKKFLEEVILICDEMINTDVQDYSNVNGFKRWFTDKIDVFNDDIYNLSPFDWPMNDGKLNIIKEYSLEYVDIGAIYSINIKK